MCRLWWNAFEFIALILWGNRTNFYIINRTIHGILEIWNLILVLNRISHSFALLTCEISLSKLKINFMFPHIHVLFIKNVDRQIVPVHYSLLLLSQFHYNIILFTYNLSKFILWCVRPPAFPRPPGCFLCFPEESKTLNFEVWMSKHNTDKKPEMHFSLLQLSFSSLKKNLSGQSQISNVFLWQISIILCNHTVLTKMT